MTCPVYCRFCFRKHKDSRGEANPTPDDVKRAVSYIRDSPRIKEIVITGGDPFLHKENMQTAIDGLMAIPHVQTLRLATRSVSYYPHLFYSDNGFWMNYLMQKNLELQRAGKRLELATHFIHPDEISPESLDIISRFMNNGGGGVHTDTLPQGLQRPGSRAHASVRPPAGSGRRAPLHLHPLQPHPRQQRLLDHHGRGSCRFQVPARAPLRQGHPPHLHGDAHREDGLAHERMGRETGRGQRTTSSG